MISKMQEILSILVEQGYQLTIHSHGRFKKQRLAVTTKINPNVLGYLIAKEDINNKLSITDITQMLSFDIMGIEEDDIAIKTYYWPYIEYCDTQKENIHNNVINFL